MSEGACTRQRGSVMVTQVDMPAVALICHRQQTNVPQHVFPSHADCRDWESPPLAAQASLKCCPLPGS